MKQLSLIILFIFSTLLANASGEWKLHPALFTDVSRVVETPGYVYFASPVSEKNDSRNFTIFRYDKDSGETLPLSSENHLSSIVAEAMTYSPHLKAMIVADISHDLHILKENGKSETVSALKFSPSDLDKTINGINYDNVGNRILLSTNFGVVSINPDRLEVAESRIYNVPITGISRIGEIYVMISGNNLLYANSDKIPPSLNDFKTAGIYDSPKSIVGGDFGFGIFSTASAVYKIFPSGESPEIVKLVDQSSDNVENSGNGMTIFTPAKLLCIDETGKINEYKLPEDITAASTLKEKDLWWTDKTLTLNSSSIDKNTGSLKTEITGIRPNAPATFTAATMKWTPELGIILCNPGHDPNFTETSPQTKIRISTYKCGLWTDYSPTHINPSALEPMSNPNGFDVDPEKPEILYFASILNGLERIDIHGTEPRIHLSRQSDPCQGLEGFTAIVNDLSGNVSPQQDLGKSWAISCPFAAPAFDNDGNLWTAFADYDDQIERSIHLFCWEKNDLRASAAGNVILPTRIKVKGPRPSTREMVYPLRSRVNRNLMLYTQRSWQGELVLIDTRGTAVENSDDMVVHVTQFIDRDGYTFSVNEIRCIWEDTSTGEVWIGHRQGVFRFRPSKFLAGDTTVERIKVSREDGTNLADYLLDEVPVNNITTDTFGRKWFATSGAGLISTTSDGRTILESHTSDNSPLPSDVVYSTAYDKDSGALLIATALGIAEYHPNDVVEEKSGSKVKIYPSPVRPDYVGFVTIEGLPEGAIAKITDASGNLVKELSPASGGMAQWDITDRNFKRVGSGVYYVLCQGGNAESAFSAVGKLMVIN